MNIEKRIEILEKEVLADAINEDEAGWRKKEALRLLPLHHKIAEIARWQDAPLPTDEELLGRELAALNRWPSRKEYLVWANASLCPVLKEMTS